MEPGTVLKPKVSEELAIELTRRLYGLDVTGIKRMVSFDDQNFHIQVSRKHHNPYLSEVSDDGYTLKITNTMKSALKDHFDSMHRAMVHSNQKGVRVPLPIYNLDGHTWKLENVPLLNEDEDYTGPKLCGIQLLTFLPGIPVSRIPYTADLLYEWGSLLAKFHNATEDLISPGLQNKSIFWNLEHIPEIKKYMEGLEEPKEKLVLSVLHKYPSEITHHWEDLPKGFIHGDFNENNIIAREKITESNDKEYSPDGVLDFEDMHYGTYVWDIGMMLAYSLLDCSTMDPLEGAGHALAGYLNFRSLSNLELSLLKICMECRLCQSLVLCAHTYRSDPSNTYLLSSSKTGWSRLEQLFNTNNEDLLEMWKKVQQGHTSKRM